MLTVVFDLGGVLASETTQVADAARRMGVAETDVGEPYWANRLPYDEGCSHVEYWSAVARAVGTEVDDHLAEELGRHDAMLWARLRPEAEQILADVSAAGQPVWLLSSAPVAMGAAIDEAPWRRHLRGRVVSGEVGLIKPWEPVYEHVESVTGAKGADLAFIDDKAHNLEVPTRRGWRTRLWSNDADTRDWLEDLGVLKPHT